MKKILHLLFATILLPCIAAAQISIEPPQVVVPDLPASEFEGIAHAFIVNNFPEEREFRWERTIVEMTEGWDNAICDVNQCYLPSIEAMEFTLAGNTQGTLDVHAYPNGLEGSAVIEVKVTDLTDTTNVATGIFYFNMEPNSTSTATEKQKIKVYPNPSQGVFAVSGAKTATKVWVYNVAGQAVKRFDYSTSDWYDINDLPRGTYLVRMLDKNEQTIVTRLLNKL